MPKNTATRVAIATVVLALVAGLGASSAAVSAKPRVEVDKADMSAVGAKPRPKRKPRKLYWGAWIGDQITGEQAPYDMSAVTAFAGLVRRQLSLLEWARPFADCSTPGCDFLDFPTRQMQAVRDYGAIPFLSWSSAATNNGDPVNQPDFQLSDVISGRYDSYIRTFATQAKAWGHPFFLRFNWEMNGNWFPWAMNTNGNRPSEYVPAWRHVHDIFTSVGATNASWVWCPYVDVQRKQNLRKLYPGGKYVDWSCLDAYNWARSPANPHRWMAFPKLFTDTYKRVTKRIAPRKPMIIGEMATSDFGGNKPLWIRNFFKSLSKYPKVRGLIYFDVNDRDTHWPLETDPAAIRAFSAGIRRRYFTANRYAGLSSSPIRPPGR